MPFITSLLFYVGVLTGLFCVKSTKHYVWYAIISAGSISLAVATLLTYN